MPRRARVRIAENFARNLDEIERFLQERGATEAFAGLVEHLFENVIPNLERFPGMGRDFFGRAPLSVEGQTRAEALRDRLGEAELREYIFGDYLLLYARERQAVTLLAIRQHRQLSFDLPAFW